MKILKLHGSRRNLGGIVSFQNSLFPYCRQSIHSYKHFRTGKIQSSRILSNSFIRLIDQLVSYLWFPFYLMAVRPDVIEINSSLVSGAFKRDRIYTKISRKFRPDAKLVLFNHGWDDDFYLSLLSSNKGGLAAYFSLFDDILVLTDQCASALKDLCYDGKIHVITTGIHLNEFLKIPISVAKREQVQLLFLARVEEAKGIGDLLEAVPSILSGYPEVRVIVAGSGSWLAQAKQKAKDLDIEDNVIFEGYVRGVEKLLLLGQSDIFIFPSYSEGCPVSILEALASGLPIIYTEVGALPSILADGTNGIAISKRCSNDIAEAVDKLISNPALVDRMRSNNLKLAKSFDMSIIHQKLEAIYTAHG